MASKIKRFMSMALMAIMIMIMVPAAVLAAGEVTEVGTWDEFVTALAENKDNIKLTADLTVDSASGVIIPSGTTIDGNSYSITAGYVGHGSYNALFVSGGSISVRNLTVVANGSDGVSCQAFSMGNGGSLSNVEIKGFPYGVFVGSTAVTISGCTFNNTNGWGIYNNATSAAHTYTNNTFNGERAVALYGNETFTGNTVTGAKGLSVATTGATITGNSFSGGRALSISADGVDISGNNFDASSTIEIDSGKTADLSGNYWGGDAPANLPSGVTWENYYKDSTMDNANLVEKVYAAQVGTAKFETLAAALENSVAGDTITLLEDVSVTTDRALEKLTGKTLDLNDKTLTVSGDQYYGAGTTTFTNGKVKLTGSAGTAFFWSQTSGANIVIDDVQISGSGSAYAVFASSNGKIEIKNSDINLSGSGLANIIADSSAVINNTDITTTNVERGFTNSTVTIKGGSEIEINGAQTGLNNSTVTIDASTVTISNATERAVRLNNNTLKLENGAELNAVGCAADIVAYKEDSKPTISVSEDSTLNAKDTVTVAKIGNDSYSTLAAALDAASAMTGDVEVEIYDKVTLNKSLSGSYDSIKFVGMEDDAEIYLDVQGYITATGKKVAFEDLTLSKSSGGFITNAGFMNVAFGVYDVVQVSYNGCYFENGAYASSGDVYFNSCTFKRSYDKYGLWAYGNVDVTVSYCKFADYRGIKMYAENAAKTVALTVKNTDFSSVTNKPAIVLTYGESVTLSGNTYSSTGVYELDLGGSPNGTPVSSDVPPTCVNDNGPCGVMVDGKIYTTVEQAVAAAKDGDTITLLAEFDLSNVIGIDKNVTIDLNGNEFDGTLTLKNADATIAGPEGLNVTTDLAGYVVVYANGVYKVVSEDATFTVTFNNNSGSGKMDPQSFVVGEAKALTANKFTRTGYTFVGWNTKKDGSGAAFANGASYTAVDNVTLYAQWAKNPSYTIRFNNNGGEGEMDPQVFVKDVAEPLNANAFTRKDFYFIGWNTEADGSGTRYSNKAEITVSEDTILYAQWTRVPNTTSYTVQYNANGGSGEVYLQVFTESMSFNLRMNEFVREGYKFVGWNTRADGKGVSYAEGAKYSGNKSIVLYAQWELEAPEFPAVRPEYKLEVDGQKGTITRTNDTSIVYDKMYIRWSIGFDTVDGPFAMIAMLDVEWTKGEEGLVGTFNIPVIETNGTISGVNYMLTTDLNANMIGVGEAVANMYGMLIK